MSEFMASALIMVSEFAFMFALGLGLVGYKIISYRRKNHSQVKDFVEKLREKESEKNKKRIETLKEKYNLDEDAIQVYIEQLTAREKSVYGKIIKIYLGKDREALGQLDDDVDALIKSCFLPVEVVNITSPNNESGEEITVNLEQVAELTEENTSLKRENEKLIIELKEIKKQSSEMMAEYAMMYGKQGEEERHKVKLEREKVKQELIDQANQSTDQGSNAEEESESIQINENSNLNGNADDNNKDDDAASTIDKPG